MKGKKKKADKLSFSDHGGTFQPECEMNEPSKQSNQTTTTTATATFTRTSMPAMQLQSASFKLKQQQQQQNDGRKRNSKSSKSSSKTRSSVMDGIAAVDSILKAATATTAEASTNNNTTSNGTTTTTTTPLPLQADQMEQLVKLKKSLEKMKDDENSKKKKKSASLIHRAYLNEDWGVNWNESDDDILSNDNDDDGPSELLFDTNTATDTFSSSDSSMSLEPKSPKKKPPPKQKKKRPTHRHGTTYGGTGMNVLLMFGAVPSPATSTKRRQQLLMDTSRRRASSSLLLQQRAVPSAARNKNKQIIRLQKLASRRPSSLTSKVQSHAPKEWYELLNFDKRKQLAKLLSWENLSKWDFDIFEIARLTHGHPLLFVGWAILSSPYSQHVMEEVLLNRSERRPVPFDLMDGYRFIDTFQIDQKKMTNFLRAIEKDYFEENPYHNNTHAADVLQTLHAMLQGMDGEAILKPTSLQLLAVLLGAVIHDVGHPGYNNFFQQSSHSDIALCYNDQSVLENMHLALAFRKLLGGKKKETVNIFANMETEDIATCRKLMIQAVLGTDMSTHFQSVNDVKKNIAIFQKKKQKKKKDDDEETSNNSYTDEDDEDEDDEDEDDEELKTTTWKILHYMMHAADISNGAKRKEIAVQWADRCLEEFFQQGDTEQKMGLPVSPLCDRHTVSRPESQSGFIEFIIQPTFEALEGLLPKVKQFILPELDQNLAFWNSQIPQKVVNDLEQLRDDFNPNDGVLSQEQQQQKEEQQQQDEEEDLPLSSSSSPLPSLNGLTSITAGTGGQSGWEDVSDEFTEEFVVTEQEKQRSSMNGGSNGNGSSISRPSDNKVLSFGDLSIHEEILEELQRSNNSVWSNDEDEDDNDDEDSQSVYDC